MSRRTLAPCHHTTKYNKANNVTTPWWSERGLSAHLVELFKLVALLTAAVAANGGHVDHASAELHKGAAAQKVSWWLMSVQGGRQSHMVAAPLTA